MRDFSISIATYFSKVYFNTSHFARFLIDIIKTIFSTRLKVDKLFSHMDMIGINSLPIIILTSTFTGMVFTLQAYVGFQRIGGEQFIGSVVALGIIKEFGPVLTGLMVTGRIGSAIAAEIGTMRITEQIDALTTLCLNPFQYLIIPRILAGMSMLPCLTLFSMAFGILGGYIVYLYVLALNPEDYVNSIIHFVAIGDIVGGILKSCIFGLILTLISSYKGFHTHGGARGVGVATTQAVVTSSVLILISNYIITKLIEQF